MPTTKTAAKTTAAKTTTTSNSKEIKSLNAKIATLENKIKDLENICTEFSSTKSNGTAVNNDEVLTRKDWVRLKKVLSSVKMPARAAELM